MTLNSIILANFGIDVVSNLPKTLETGIYYGWASVDNDVVHKMVMSIGWNPFYENEHKSMVSRSVIFMLILKVIESCHSDSSFSNVFCYEFKQE